MDRDQVRERLRALFAGKADGAATAIDEHGGTIQATAGVAFEAVVAARRITGEREIDAEYGHVGDYADAAALYGFALGYALAREQRGV